MEAVARQNMDYEVIKAASYVQGVAKLRKAGEQPKTFKENIQARVVAYENGDRQLFETWLDSCTAVANKAHSTKFKVVPQSTNLLNIPAHFNKSFLPVDYDIIQEVEVDSSEMKYNQGLTKGEVLDHPGWLLAVEADAPLLKTYRDIVFTELRNPKTAMRFYVRQNPDQDELRALFVFNLGYDSYAYGNNSLNNGGSFLRGSPVVRSAAGAAPEKQALEQKVAKILSPFDKYVGTVNQKQYQREKQEVVQELLELYKGR